MLSVGKDLRLTKYDLACQMHPVNNKNHNDKNHNEDKKPQSGALRVVEGGESQQR